MNTNTAAIIIIVVVTITITITIAFNYPSVAFMPTPPPPLTSFLSAAIWVVWALFLTQREQACHSSFVTRHTPLIITATGLTYPPTPPLPSLSPPKLSFSTKFPAQIKRAHP